MKLGNCPALLKERPHCFCAESRCCFCREYKWNLEARALEQAIADVQMIADIFEDDGSDENIDYASTS